MMINDELESEPRYGRTPAMSALAEMRAMNAFIAASDLVQAPRPWWAIAWDRIRHPLTRPRRTTWIRVPRHAPQESQE